MCRIVAIRYKATCTNRVASYTTRGVTKELLSELEMKQSHWESRSGTDDKSSLDEPDVLPDSMTGRCETISSEEGSRTCARVD